MEFKIFDFLTFKHIFLNLKFLKYFWKFKFFKFEIFQLKIIILLKGLSIDSPVFLTCDRLTLLAISNLSSHGQFNTWINVLCFNSFKSLTFVSSLFKFQPIYGNLSFFNKNIMNWNFKLTKNPFSSILFTFLGSVTGWIFSLNSIGYSKSNKAMSVFQFPFSGFHPG